MDSLVSVSLDPPIVGVVSGTRRVVGFVGVPAGSRSDAVGWRLGGVPKAGWGPVEVRQRSRDAQMGSRSSREIGGFRLRWQVRRRGCKFVCIR